MILRFNHHTRPHYPEYPGKSFKVIEWDPIFKEDTLENVLSNHPKDLCFIILPKDVCDTLSLYKSFYKLPEIPPHFSLQDAFVSMGGIEAIYSEEHKTYELHVLCPYYPENGG